MSKLVKPHGGILVDRLVDKDLRRAILSGAKKLKKINLTSREVSDALMIGMGAFSPLKGFMNKENYERVVEDKRLTNGVVWPLPITLSVDEAQADSIKIGQEMALVDEESGTYIGIMTVNDIYLSDKDRECESVFFTRCENHVGVQKVLEQKEYNVGGDIKIINLMGYDERFEGDFATPKETRAIFDEKGFKTVTAFQTRNPLHRSHEFLCKLGAEVSDGLFIHPIVGKLKEGDIPAETRLKCYEALLDNYFNADNTVMKVYPMEMRYAGPSEAILHAIIRQNYGCSNILIGRDHAGVGDYYTSYQAQEIFDEFNESELLCRPIKVSASFYCKKCGALATEKTCPHTKEDRLSISGTKVRQLLGEGRDLPAEFSRPEVLKILKEYYMDKG